MTGSQDLDHLFECGDALSAEGMQARRDGREEDAKARWREAIRAYEEALALAPAQAAVVRANLELCIGARHLGLEEIDEARRRTETALALVEELSATDPEAAEAYAQGRLNRAECALQAGDAAAARAEVEAVLRTFPDHPYGTWLLGRVGKP